MNGPLTMRAPGILKEARREAREREGGLHELEAPKFSYVLALGGEEG